jgi:hypothetical protein
MLALVSLIAQVDTAGAQLHNFFRVLATPTGFVALAILVALGFAVALAPRSKWYVLGAMFFASTLAVTSQEYFRPVLIFPFEQMRQQGRGITLGLMIALLLPALTALRGWRQTLLPAAAWMYLAFEIILCMRLGIGGLPERAVFGLMVFLMTFAVMAFGLSRWLQDISDTHRLFRGITFGAGLLVGVTAILLLRDRSQVIHAGRLWGATGNAQHLAVASALFLGPVTYMVIQRTEAKVWRLFAGAVAALLVILLVWTGSRTGALMAAVQFPLLFRLRIGKLLGFALVGGIFLLLGLLFFPEGFEGADRLVSVQNTRAEVWQRLIEDFKRSPILGGVGDDVSVGESSYLSIAGRMGLVGVIPFAVLLFLGVREIYRLHRVRRLLGDYVLLADMVTAGLATLAAGAFFEGYLMGTLSIGVFFIYFYLTLMGFLVELGNSVAHEGATALTGDALANTYHEAEVAYEADY